jgi:hypothetical protein
MQFAADTSSTVKETAMKRPISLTSYLAGVAFAAILAPASAFAQAASLDGKSFEGVIIEKGKTRGDADTLIFKDGRFRSTACDQYGFSEATYTVVNEGNVARFETKTESPRHGQLQWTGYVRGDKLDATVIWVRSGKAPVERWYVGTLKK